MTIKKYSALILIYISSPTLKSLESNIIPPSSQLTVILPDFFKIPSPPVDGFPPTAIWAKFLPFLIITSFPSQSKIKTRNLPDKPPFKCALSFLIL